MKFQRRSGFDNGRALLDVDAARPWERDQERRDGARVGAGDAHPPGSIIHQCADGVEVTFGGQLAVDHYQYVRPHPFNFIEDVR